MSIENIEVVRGFYAATNAGDFDKAGTLCDKECRVKGAAYVGCGFMVDEKDTTKIIVLKTLKGAPADGRLKAGDEILSVVAGDRRYEGYAEMSRNPWGPGAPGTKVLFTVRREGREVQVELTRAKIPAHELSYADMRLFMEAFLRDWPDRRDEPDLFIDGGDYVTVVSLIGGTSKEFKKPAFWQSISVFRLRGGKIVEMQGVEDGLAMYKQLGYTITAP
jgi:C-terminal processing protease CtpA/Prc